ncbi:MAG: DUF1501 domain-containing protein [Pirellulales bacterium]|nr:DUF1501 domain-containing protein [Pirellulales bacterium]
MPMLLQSRRHDGDLARLTALTRRAFLGSSCGSLGSLALAHLAQREARAAESAVPPRKARAKSVICLFQHGGPSQMDLFDPKPELVRRNGEEGSDKFEIHFKNQRGKLLGSPFTFTPAGQCGMELSELLPHTASIADRITLVRSMHTFSVDHEAALRLIHTGKAFPGRPTWGAWSIYGLGTENESLPAYVVLADPQGLPIDGVNNWASGWLPAQYQGTPFRSGDSPVLNLNTPGEVTPAARAAQRRLLDELNAEHLARFPENGELAARISQYETAARMQSAVPEVMDFSDETAETRELYGLDRKESQEYGARCLLARRLVERGVRFVQLFLNGQPWDTHNKNAESLRGLCARTDQPSAALVIDLARRGLLDSTIVMWTGEFGRQPISQGTDGRDHNRHAFSLWLAGGGFRAGYVHGATDEFAYAATENRVSVHDLHATLLDALGLDHMRLTWPHDGRDDSLTDEVVTQAQVVSELLA